MLKSRAVARTLVAVLLATAISVGLMWATAGSGTVSQLLGRATYADFKVKRMLPGDWEVDVKAKSGLDIATQVITFLPGGQSGWHRHPGPVFASVIDGELRFYEGDDPTCTPIIRRAGQGYVDRGEHPHIARNQTTANATVVVTYFAPPGAPALRIDAPAPGNCSF